jgi:hypothetical protein
MKAMKFWIGDDPELSKRVQAALFAAGYAWHEYGKTPAYTGERYIYAHAIGELGYGVDESFYRGRNFEEVNIDWMRTKKETVELFGKKYDERVLKERLADCPTIEE